MSQTRSKDEFMAKALHKAFPSRAFAKAKVVSDPETAFYRDRDEAVLSRRKTF